MRLKGFPVRRVFQVCVCVRTLCWDVNYIPPMVKDTPVPPSLLFSTWLVPVSPEDTVALVPTSRRCVWQVSM